MKKKYGRKRKKADPPFRKGAAEAGYPSNLFHGPYPSPSFCRAESVTIGGPTMPTFVIGPGPTPPRDWRA